MQASDEGIETYLVESGKYDMKKLLGLLVAIVLLSAACSSSGTATVTDVGGGGTATTAPDDTTGTSTTVADGNDRDAADDLCEFLEDSRDRLSGDDADEDAANEFLIGLADRLPGELSDEADDLRALAAADLGTETGSDDSFDAVERYALARCDFDDDFFSSDSGDSGDSGGDDDRGDTFGDNAELDALWTACEDGDDSACDELYWTSPIGSEYEDFGQDCGGRERQGLTSCAADDGDVGGNLDADDYGDDPDLDALYDSCEAGNEDDCDTLYWTSPVGSAYEEFGDTCGGRVPGGVGSCSDTSDESSGSSYGDDEELDALYDKCRDGDDVACDTLYFESPFGSEYEEFGDSCGGRGGQDADGFCGPRD